MAALPVPRVLASKALMDEQQDTHVTLSCTQKKTRWDSNLGLTFFLES